MLTSAAGAVGCHPTSCCCLLLPAAVLPPAAARCLAGTSWPVWLLLLLPLLRAWWRSALLTCR